MNTVQVPLTQGKSATIDADDAERVQGHSWHAVWTGYNFYARNSDGTYLHRFLMDAKEGEQIDHIDLKPLNCVKSNLRRATNAQNGQNKEKHPNNTSGYKGVYWSKVRSRWMAYISVQGKRINLGYYDDLEYAARIYDQAAREYHEKFARLNFPNESVAVEMSTKKVRRDSSVGYRGVYFDKRDNCYRARITCDGKTQQLGRFDTAEDAARAYNEAAPGVFGPDAAINLLTE